MKTKNFFNFLRVVAISALVCTIIVTLIMMVYSATPGEKSAQQSNQVAEDIKDVFDVEEEKVESARVQLSEVKGFIGETYKMTTKYFPESTTDKEVTYSSANPNIVEVNDAGELTFKATGIAKVTVALKNNPSVKHSASMTCFGTHPNKITSISPWNESYKAGTTQSFFLKDQNGTQLLLSMFQPTGYDTTALSFTASNIMPLREGKSSAKFSIKSGLGKKDYTAKTFENALTINVAPNPNYKQPTGLVLANDGVYDLKLGDEFFLPDLIKEVLPAGASKDGFSYSYKAEIVKQLTGAKVSGQQVGSVQVKIYTKYNPTLVQYATINVFNPPPSKLSVTGVTNARAQYDKTYDLKAFGDDNYVDDVTWSIVSGPGAISEDGKLSGLKLWKKVTVRATYNDDPTLYTDYQIKVVMYENFASSIRKLIGHFLLFAVIGFGLAYTYVFMIKPRALSVPLAIASGFGLSVVSEALQLPAVTTGRYAAWSDVFIDFFGSLLGIVVAFALFLLIMFFFKLSRSRKEFDKAFNAVSLFTVFRSTDSPKLQQKLASDAAPARKNKSKRS